MAPEVGMQITSNNTLANRFSFNMNDCLSWSCIEFVAFANALHSIACGVSLIRIATIRYSSLIWFYRYLHQLRLWVEMGDLTRQHYNTNPNT